MPFKTVRARRYEKLRKDGFTKVEANVLSKIPEKVPYLQAMRNDRKAILKKAVKDGVSEAKYIKSVKELYQKEGWSEYGIQASKPLYKFDIRAVYRMLRQYEDTYRDEKGSQAFKSPWVKKLKQFTDFSKKFDNSFRQFHD